jgi:ribonuclease P protein component
MGNTLNRSEMLKSKIQINQLFEKGFRVNKYPLKALVLPLNDPEQNNSCLFMVMASAKKYKKAVTRNRIKRKIKEAYRLNKNLIYPYLTENNKKCLLGVMYNGHEIPTFDEIEKSMIVLLKRIQEKYENNNW